MYGLDCSNYQSTFPTLNQLLDGIMESGQDPNYEIVKNGEGTGETAWDHIGHLI